MTQDGGLLPQWQVSTWLNATEPLTLAQLRGKVIAICAFQMLCPGCVSHGIPQAKAIHQAFPVDRLQVIGLHTVFEHHAAMGEVALKAFVHEYRIHFPVGIDQPDPDGGAIPLTMQSWQLQGTPTLLLVDHQGRLRLRNFGQIDDLRAGAIIGQLLAEAQQASSP